MKKRILLATNGCKDAWPSIEYSIWMAKTFSMPLTLLGIIEGADEEPLVQEMFSKTVTLFQKEEIEYDLQLVNGTSEEVLRAYDWQDDQMLLIGPLGRSNFQHWLQGRTFRQIFEDVAAPILYVRKAKESLKKILLCMGGVGHAELVSKYAISLAAQTQAAITFLHVVPPVDLDYPPAIEMQENWDHLLETDTPPAQNLKKARQHAQEKGIQAQVKVRHGDIVNQIIGELEENDYDLVCMGSSFSHPSLRQLYAPNVTAEIADEISCPLLTVRCNCHLSNPK